MSLKYIPVCQSAYVGPNVNRFSSQRTRLLHFTNVERFSVLLLVRGNEQTSSAFFTTSRTVVCAFQRSHDCCHPRYCCCVTNLPRHPVVFYCFGVRRGSGHLGQDGDVQRQDTPMDVTIMDNVVEATLMDNEVAEQL